MENLMLALRGPGKGAAEELHELWHWVASGGASSRFTELRPAVADLIEKARGL
jgi:hypothetical protein